MGRQASSGQKHYRGPCLKPESWYLATTPILHEGWDQGGEAGAENPGDRDRGDGRASIWDWAAGSLEDEILLDDGAARASRAGAIGCPFCHSTHRHHRLITACILVWHPAIRYDIHTDQGLAPPIATWPTSRQMIASLSQTILWTPLSIIYGSHFEEQSRATSRVPSRSMALLTVPIRNRKRQYRNFCLL